MTVPPLIAVVPVILRLANGLVVPTAPVKVTLPVMLRSRAVVLNELSVLLKVTGLLPAFNTVVAFKVTLSPYT